MSSPYTGFDNSVLTFQVKTPEVETDELGNVKAVTRPVRVIAKMQQSRVVQQKKPSDLDDGAILLEGCCVEPMQLPLIVKGETWADIDFSGTPGFFFLCNPINPPHGRKGIGEILEKEAGTKIVGWFQTSRNKQ